MNVSITFYRHVDCFQVLFDVKTSLNCAISSTDKKWDEPFHYSKYLFNHSVINGAC